MNIQNDAKIKDKHNHTESSMNERKQKKINKYNILLKYESYR